MNERPEIISETRRWIEKAEHDLLAAEHMLILAERGLTDIICFHCQQSAEKYLKGLLVCHGMAFPKTHDLRILLELACKKLSVDLSFKEVLPLNRYAIEGRYPGEWDPIDKQEAIQAIHLAQLIRNAVRRLMPNEIAG